ncbi:MAG: protein kinase [Gemmataceae bacterium]
MGIVHRDIKPANLILDADGHLWVTDFGLAKLDTAAGMTVSGDLLGTLRYMSPEQALARHGLVDHRTDVYSLGATLYELLTLRPAVDAEDKHEILRRIAFEEPAPPRKLDKAIPAELETVTLKALAKNPAERYATAGELAADLRRFLTDQPIRAKPPTVSQRAGKWARRHRAVVAAAAAFLVLLAAGSAVSTAFVWRKEADTRTALKRANAERVHALANVKHAQDALDAVYLRLARSRSPEPPRPGDPAPARLPPESETLLKELLGFYERFAGENADDHGARFELANAYLRVGQIRKDLGLDEWDWHTDRGIQLLRDLAREFPTEQTYRDALWNALAAAEHFQEVVALLERDAAASPSSPGPQWALAVCYRRWVESLEAGGRPAEAERVWPKVVEHAELNERISPSGDKGQGLHQIALGCFARAAAMRARRDPYRNAVPDPTLLEAEAALLRQAHDIWADKMLAAAMPPHWRANGYRTGSLGTTCRYLGALLLETGEPAAAEPHLTRAVGLHAQALTTTAGSPAMQNPFPVELIKDHLALARAWTDLGRPGEAEQAARAAVGVARPVVAADVWWWPAYQQGLAAGLHALAGLVHDRGDRAEARRLWRRAVDHARRAADLQPGDPNLVDGLAWLLATCPEDELRAPDEAVGLAKQAVAHRPGSSRFRNTLGAALYRTGSWGEAVAVLEKSAELGRGGGAFDFYFLAMAQARLGEPAKARAWYDKAVAWTDRHKPKDDELRRFRAEAEEVINGPVKPNS